MRSLTMSPRRGGGAILISKAVMSATNRPVVNTGVGLGNTRKAKAVASIRNGFGLRIPAGNMLVISFVKCRRRRITIGKGAVLGVGVTRSTRVVSRIIMATLNVGQRRGTLKCTIRGINKDGLSAIGPIGVTASLANGITNLGMAGDARFGATPALGLHNRAPLLMMSNIPCDGVSLGSVTTSSVRSISILGKTATSTLCNTHKNSKTVVIAAGGNDRRKLGVSMGDDAVFGTNCLMLPRMRRKCDANRKNGCATTSFI